MKKLVFICIALSLVLGSVACRKADASIETNKDIETNQDTEAIIETDIGIFEKYPSFYELTADDVAILYSPKFENFLVEETIALNLEDELKTFAEKPTAPEEFKTLYYEADDIQLLNTYGFYLDDLSFVGCLFYRNEKLIGYMTLNVVSSNGKPRIEISSSQSSILESNSGIFQKINSCMTEYPNYRIVGLNFYSIAATYLLVEDNNGYIKSYNARHIIDNLRYIDSYKSVEECRRALAEYWLIRTEIESRIPGSVESDGTYVNHLIYDNSHVPEGDNIRYPYMYIYDWSEHVLLCNEGGIMYDKDGKFCGYVVEFLFYRNELVAEVVLAYDENGEMYAVSERVAEITDLQNKVFTPLESVDYLDQVSEEFWRLTKEGKEIKGIGYNNGIYSVITAEVE